MLVVREHVGLTVLGQFYDAPVAVSSLLNFITMCSATSTPVSFAGDLQPLNVPPILSHHTVSTWPFPYLCIRKQMGGCCY